MNIGDIVMSAAEHHMREYILKIIEECSSEHNINESCSVGYVALNQRKLKCALLSIFDSSCGLNKVEFTSSTPIRKVIDVIIKNMPVDAKKNGTDKNIGEHSMNDMLEMFGNVFGELQHNSKQKNDEAACTKTTLQNDNAPHTFLQAQTTPSKSLVMNNTDKNKIEYVIGIDLGHGETSAAICALQWDKSVEQLEPAKDLEMGGNKKVIPSAITILDNGNAYIGDSAFNPEILKQANVNVCFKKAPKDINGVSEQLMIRFMQEVYRRIRENNSAMLTDDNHLVYIATPSGWDKETQDLYLLMAKQAGLPVAGVTKESRAAFVRAQHDVTSGIGKYIEKGAVVFDMGSSTLDFTFMRANSKLIDNGYDCGASFIEKTIFKDCEENNPVIRKFEEKYGKLTSYLLFEARKVKEQVYFDPSLKVKKTINFEDFIDDEDFEDDRYKMVYKPGELDDLLEKVGYIKEIENAAIDFANNHIHHSTIYGVFLTGGASRMDFIKPLVSRCWNVPESQIYRDQDPSLTISQGVAEVARMDLRTEGMDTGLEDEISSIIANDTVFYRFSDILGDKLKDDITTVIANVITAFKDDKEDWTLYELRQTITQYVNDDVKTVLAEAPQMLNDAIEDTTQEVRNKVSLIIANYSNQGVNVTMPQLAVGNIDINGINLDSVIESISETIEVESSNWLKYVLMGAGAIFGFIGMGIGYLAGKIFGEKEMSEAEKRDKAMSKSLDSDEREQVYDALAEKWDDIVENINNAIDKSIAKNNKMHQTIKQATNKLLEDYKKALKNARILID